jgi:subtilase family serine protease
VAIFSTGSLLRRPAIALVALTLVLAALLVGGAGRAGAEERVPYPLSVPTWATSGKDAGATPGDTTVEGELYLPLRDLPGAEALAGSVSDPSSAGYGRWVTPQQWIDQFSPPAAAYDSVVAYLQQAGLTITGTPASRLFVVFRGTAAQVGAAFGTAIHQYRVGARRLAAPMAPPSLPQHVAAAVSGMELDQGRSLTHPDFVPADAGRDAVSSPADSPATLAIPCSTYYGQYSVTLPPAYGRTSFPTGVCGYLPAQLRAAYGVPSTASPVVLSADSAGSSGSLSGSGQTVAVIDAYASPSIVGDVNTYSARHGEPALRGGQYRQIVPTTFYDEAACGNPSGWQTEQTIDVEAVHGMAPGAHVLYVGGFNCGGGLDVALSRVLDGRLATIVSNSYGAVGEALPADVLRGMENLHLQAVAEGIGLYFSSGDNGDEAAQLGSPQPDYPASSPWVTAVGGTSTGVGADGGVTLETGWGTTQDLIVQDPSGTLSYASPPPGPFISGAGGGASTIFAQPAYQSGIVPAGLAGGHRVSPDIAADADPHTGFLIGIRPIVDDATLATGPYQEARFGGTSLASPLVAAQMALVQQATGRTLGFVNPAMYALYREAPQLFRDVVPPGSPFALADISRTDGKPYLWTGDMDSSLSTAPHYDDVTGLGAVDLNVLRRMATG